MAEHLTQIEIDRLAVKQAAEMFIRTLDAVGVHSGKTRELSLAKTHVENAEMWAQKHLGAAHV